MLLNEDTNQYSMTFDGDNDYVNLGYYNNYNLNSSTTSITAMFNVKVLQFGYQGNEAYILGTPMFGGNNDRGFSVRTIANNQFQVAAGGNSNIVYGYSSEKDINKWYHVTIVIDQNLDLMHLYVDGVLESQVSISDIGTINNNYNINIGAFENNSWVGNLFSGFVDNVSIGDSTF